MIRKKMIGVILATLMIGCMGVSVGTHETNDVATVSEIMPRGAICDNCGEGEMLFRKGVERALMHDYPCSHYNYGRDYNYKVTTTTYWKCTKCSYRVNITETITYETDCQGHN